MRILLVTCVKNEGPFLLEWIAHYRNLGINDFLIYSNDCNDGTDILLDALARSRIIVHERQSMENNHSPQWEALKKARAHRLYNAADWVMTCDVDEFVCIHTGEGRFDDLFAAVPPDTEAIALSWRLFGNAGIVRFIDAPVTTQFTKAAPLGLQYPIAATFFKTLFRTNGPFNKLGVHRPRQKNVARHGVPRWVDGAGHPLASHIAENDERMSLLGVKEANPLAECNHYSLRSAESYLAKARRGLPNRQSKPIDLQYWIRRNFNQVEVTHIRRYQSELVQGIEYLRQLPSVYQAHVECVYNYKNFIKDGLNDSGLFEMFCDIILAGPSRAPDNQSAKNLYQQAQKILESG